MGEPNRKKGGEIMKLTKKQEKEIRILDLIEAFENIKKSDTDEIWFRELTAIDNAIKFIKKHT